MRRLRHHGWTLGGGIAVALPALLVVTNADVLRLVVGLSGFRWRPLLFSGLTIGLVICGIGLWRNRKQKILIAFAGIACASMAILWWRGGVAARSVRFTHGDMRYAATLYLPQPSVAGNPAVIFVPGSAPFKRAFYDLWAERIARAGFAVLVTDKRGVGETSGTFEHENNSSLRNLTLLAGDAVAAVDYLATLPEIDSTSIGLVGFSQAGWVAPLAATMSPRVRYMALISGPAVSVHEENIWSAWRGEDHASAKYSRAVAERMMDTVTRSGVDARSVLGGVSVPGLWLLGTDDNSMPTSASAHALDSLARLEGKPFSVDTFPGYGHLLIGRRGALLPRIAPESWDALIRWLQLHSRRRA